MFNEDLYGKLSMFNVVHLITLGVFILCIIVLYILRTKISGNNFEKGFRITLGIFLLVFESSYHIWVLSRGGYGLSMIPFFGFCALTNLLTIIALLANKPKMFNYLIYYAVTGAFFSLVFVDTPWTIPHFRFFHYFLVHFGFLLASLYYYFTKRITISFKIFKRVILIAFVYTFVILAFDLILQENWFYLLENPVPAISNALGTPFYTILWIIFILFFMSFWYFILNGFKLRAREK